MAFIDKTKSNYSFKVLQGKAHTSNSKELVNESIKSGLIMSSDRIFANLINPIPSSPLNIGVVSEQVTLTIKPIVGSDDSSIGTWSSYRCYLEDVIPNTLIGVVNPLTGSTYSLGDTVGNIIPESFGSDFRPILYSDSLATIEISPTDASDWILDPYAGVITQESDDVNNMFKTSVSVSGTHNGRLKAYIYIGEYVINKLNNKTTIDTDWINSVIATASIIPSAPSNGDRYLLDNNATGITFSQYNPISESTNLFTASGWEAIEYYSSTQSGWIVTEPKTSMTVSIISDQNAVYQYYGGSYKRQSFEQTYPTSANKNMVCNVTINDGDLATPNILEYTPTEGSYIEVLVNGIQIEIENTATQGQFVTADAYFSSETGLTHSIRSVKSLDNLMAGDRLYWMGDNAGYELDSTDKIDYNYVISNNI